MSPEDQAYYLSRAEQELERAQRSEHADAVKAHYHLAGFYLDLVYGEGSTVNADPRDKLDENPISASQVRFTSPGH